MPSLVAHRTQTSQTHQDLQVRFGFWVFAFTTKKKMLRFIFLLHLYLLVSTTDASTELLNLHDSDPQLLKSLSHTGVPVAVSVSDEHLPLVGSTVLSAESWLRTHVLSHFPATKITTIVVGTSVLCNKTHQQNRNLVLPSVKNLYHSLARWKLNEEIKVSAAISTDCLVITDTQLSSSSRFREDLAENFLKPLLNFLQNSNSSYIIDPPSNVPLFPSKITNLVSIHEMSIKKLGFLQIKNVGLISNRKPIIRKLYGNVIDPFPARPTPLPENSPPSPLHHSIGFSTPATIVNNPHPSPFTPIANPPGNGFSFAPEIVIPTNPPEFSPQGSPSPPLPRCLAGPPPETGVKQGLWCVAKPSVPSDTLQGAMDYACGEGGADCEAVMPLGSCYFPDSVVAHASYAFNSYWQKNKHRGGTCDFGGTAMIVTSDPSFQQCRFLRN